jgi:hypothetical protein
MRSPLVAPIRNDAIVSKFPVSLDYEIRTGQSEFVAWLEVGATPSSGAVAEGSVNHFVHRWRGLPAKIGRYRDGAMGTSSLGPEPAKRLCGHFFFSSGGWLSLSTVATFILGLSRGSGEVSAFSLAHELDFFRRTYLLNDDEHEEFLTRSSTERTIGEYAAPR